MSLQNAFATPSTAAVPLTAPPEVVSRPKKRPRSPSDADDAAASGGAAAHSRRERKRRHVESAKTETPERMARTVFIANVPVQVTRKEMHNLVRDTVKESLEEDGEEVPERIVESVRFRSVPLSATSVPSSADHHVMRKASFIKERFDTKTGETMNAYAVMVEEAMVARALRLHGLVLGGHHLRVSPADRKPTEVDKNIHKRCVFVGHIPFDASEDEVRTFFATNLTMGDGAIDYVRMLRDRVTNKGKGVAYVAFHDSLHVAEALGLQQIPFRGEGKPLQISPCKPKHKLGESHPSGRGVAVPAFMGTRTGKSAPGKDANSGAKKKKKTNVNEGARGAVSAADARRQLGLSRRTEGQKRKIKQKQRKTKSGKEKVRKVRKGVQ